MGDYLRSKQEGFAHVKKGEEARGRGERVEASREFSAAIRAYSGAAKNQIDRNSLIGAVTGLAEMCRLKDIVEGCERSFTEGYRLIEKHWPEAPGLRGGPAEALGDYYMERKNYDSAIIYYSRGFSSAGEKCGPYAEFPLKNVLNAYLGKGDRKKFDEYWAIAAACNAGKKKGATEFYLDPHENTVVLRVIGGLPPPTGPEPARPAPRFGDVSFQTPVLLGDAIQALAMDANRKREELQREVLGRSDEGKKLLADAEKQNGNEKRDFEAILAKEPSLADEMRKKFIKSLASLQIGMEKSAVFALLPAPKVERTDERLARFAMIAGEYLDPRRVPTVKAMYVDIDARFDEKGRLASLQFVNYGKSENWVVGTRPPEASPSPSPTNEPRNPRPPETSDANLKRAASAIAETAKQNPEKQVACRVQWKGAGGDREATSVARAGDFMGWPCLTFCLQTLEKNGVKMENHAFPAGTLCFSDGQPQGFPH